MVSTTIDVDWLSDPRTHEPPQCQGSLFSRRRGSIEDRAEVLHARYGDSDTALERRAADRSQAPTTNLTSRGTRFMSIAFADATIARSREPRTWTLFLAITPTGHSHSRDGFLPHRLLRNPVISRPETITLHRGRRRACRSCSLAFSLSSAKNQSLWNKAFVTYDVCSMLWHGRTLS